MSPRIVLGVSGGIAAFKSAEVLRELVRRGAEVRVVMTRGAKEFISPLTFAVLSGHEVHVEVWGQGNSPAVDHVALADWADLLVVAPATAHTLAKFAHGLADDFLSTYFLAHRKPVLVAPAMESAMWESAAVRDNVQRLRERGLRFVGPASGPLASGHEGPGRMSEPAEIVAEAWAACHSPRDLAGMRLLVTAGPTREPIDPIRFLSNRSSGKMGYALAEAARDRGARVTLLSGPSALPIPLDVRFFRFETGSELYALLQAEFPACDGLAMAAAVGDFLPERSPRRLHRQDGERDVRLTPGRDILAALAPMKAGQTVIAFAAETEDLEARARRKMEEKDADAIVINDVSRRDIGFDSDQNEIIILLRDGGRETVGRAGKRQIADRIWDALLRIRQGAGLGTADAGLGTRKA